MRVLVAACSERTQAMPMVPIAWALRCAGHDVLTASQPELVDTIADAGLPVVSVGRNLPLYRLWRHDQSGGHAPTELNLAEPDTPVSFAVLRDGYRDHVQWWWRSINEPMIADLVTLCRQWRPDLVIWEAVTYAGAVAARATGTPHARFLWTADVFALMRRRFLAEAAGQDPPERTDPLAAWLTACVERFGAGFDEELVTGQSTITFLPPSLRRADPSGIDYLPVRFVPYNGRAVLPAWLRDPPERRRVAVTLGTSAIERFGRYVVPVKDILEGLAELDVEVVATIADQEHDGLGTVPRNVRLTSYVPLDALAASCHVVIDHGGPGTVCTVLTHGVPQLVVPEEFDAPLLAGLLADTGAAERMTPEEATAGAVRDATARLLDDPRPRAAAAALREEARAMPSPRQLVSDLVSLAGR
ncbi:MAG: nucleotide disphospho-sugar-binding domain-containing protein [Kineosporiaceae bacterium]